MHIDNCLIVKVYGWHIMHQAHLCKSEDGPGD